MSLLTFAAWIAASIASKTPASGVQTSFASRAARSCSGLISAGTFACTAPTATTKPTHVTPNSASRHFASAPAATRAAVSRAEARSSVLRQSAVSHFMLPAKSACPGRGRLISGASSIRKSRFGISITTGDPIVWPRRTPLRIVTASFSILCRPLRP